ncbi:hypothetical protein JZ751_013677 [Albula glossodonta]|uniref:Uncharacterized protein n=1 Tax=Albula glossodonta TaxID=121402 RepID=A0A8T2NWP5_9TELE|nr:hypothetical protein JZ751_013677 [Albula glossodonta]
MPSCTGIVRQDLKQCAALPSVSCDGTVSYVHCAFGSVLPLCGQSLELLPGGKVVSSMLTAKQQLQHD